MMRLDEVFVLGEMRNAYKILKIKDFQDIISKCIIYAALTV
jgi:hypothetical protein